MNCQRGIGIEIVVKDKRVKEITQGETQGQIVKRLYIYIWEVQTLCISHKRYMWEGEKQLGRMIQGKKNNNGRGRDGSKRRQFQKAKSLARVSQIEWELKSIHWIWLFESSQISRKE